MTETTSTTRVAKCYCGRTEPVDTNIVRMGFYEFQGEGSEWATTLCAAERCGYRDTVHQAINPHTGREGITDHEFVARGARDHDTFYCGCRGWD